MHSFYQAFCREQGICQEAWELELLRDLVDYNVLISPKPAWKPERNYTFTYDVHAICRDMLTEIYWRDDAPAQNSADGSAEKWPDRADKVRSRLADLLTPEYVASMRKLPATP